MNQDLVHMDHGSSMIHWTPKHVRINLHLDWTFVFSNVIIGFYLHCHIWYQVKYALVLHFTLSFPLSFLHSTQAVIGSICVNRTFFRDTPTVVNPKNATFEFSLIGKIIDLIRVAVPCLVFDRKWKWGEERNTVCFCFFQWIVQLFKTYWLFSFSNDKTP